MIGKSHSGGGFGGLTRYLLTGRKDEPNPDRVLWTSTRELALEDPREAAVLMRATAAQGHTDKPVQHMSISLAPGEHLSREQWEKVIDTTLRDLGLEGHQALIVAHQDTAQEHIHLMVNRVHPETYRAWDRWQDRPRLMESLRPQELALGLQPTPHVKNPDLVPDGLVQQFERTGEPPLLDFARATARSIFQEAGSWSELHERLAKEGLYLERKGQGLVVSDDHRHIKASSVDRSASLRALEARLGAYQEPRPVLQEVDRALRSESRERELAQQLAPLRSVYQERTLAQVSRDDAASRLEGAGRALGRATQEAYRDPAEASKRYVARLQNGGSPNVAPIELGSLRGSVLHLGRNYLPLGSEGDRAFRVAVEKIPRLGVEYQQSRTGLASAEDHLADVYQRLERLEQRFQPQLQELRRLEAGQRNLPEALMSLRPRDQIILARAHGAEVVERAARRATELAGRPITAREEWMRNLAPSLDRALDRRLMRRDLEPPSPGRTSFAWLESALDRGLKPAHAVQALVRAGIPLVDSMKATSRAISIVDAAIRNPAKTAVRLTANALGVPALPLRLASLSWSLARDVVRQLSR